MLSPFSGISSCFLIALIYVCTLYLIPSEIRKLPRDDSEHIKWRMIAASASTLLCFCSSVAFLPSLLTHGLSPDIREKISIKDILCLRCDSMLEIIFMTLGLMCIFYLGPIVVATAHIITKIRYSIGSDGTLGPLPRPRSIREMIDLIFNDIDMYSQHFTHLELFRNFFFAPLSEEIVFRVLMVPYLYAAYVAPSLMVTVKNDEINLQNMSPLQLQFHYSVPGTEETVSMSSWNGSLHKSLVGPWAVALLCPSFFGLAHLHHLKEKINNGVPLTSALISTLVQFTYTSIFGLIATLLLMRTSCLLSPLISHIFCNFMGLPDLGYLKQPGKRFLSSPLSHLFGYRYILLALNAIGLIMFAMLLFPFTEEFAVHSMYWPSPIA